MGQFELITVPGAGRVPGPSSIVLLAAAGLVLEACRTAGRWTRAGPRSRAVQLLIPLMFTASLTSAPAVVHADLLVSSFDTNEIRRYDGTTEASLGNFVTVGSGGLDGPMGLAFGPDGHLYVSSSLTGAVLRYSGTTGLSWTPSSPWEAAASQCPLGSSSTCSETAPSM